MERGWDTECILESHEKGGSGSGGMTGWETIFSGVVTDTEAFDGRRIGTRYAEQILQDPRKIDRHGEDINL